jgi:hypothetical protein
VISNKQPQSDFERYLVSEYFRLGSINKVFQDHKYNLPISFAGYDRILNKYRVVKSAGPNSKISESLFVLSLLADYKISLEKVYHRFAPKTLQISTNTLHRILHFTRLGLTRRQGTALIISLKEDPNMVLFGKDLSLTNSSLGNKGDISLPMGHSKIGEPIKDTILRILQNEVFTNKVLDNSFPWEVLPKHIKPIMYINIADIQVSVYKLKLPKKINQFSSFKLSNLKYLNINKLPKTNFRPGIIDILQHYRNIQNNTSVDTDLIFDSELNSKIFALAKEPVE